MPFYQAGGVPDTMEGRFAMINVHMFLLLERLRREGDAGQLVGRALLEAFATDMDDSMREIGIGDLSVPRRVKKAAAALHEQLEVYRAAMSAAGNGMLEEALTRYVYPEAPNAAAPALASYMRSAQVALDRQMWKELAAGDMVFPAFAH